MKSKTIKIRAHCRTEHAPLQIEHRVLKNNDRTAARRLRPGQREIAAYLMKKRFQRMNEDPRKIIEELIAENAADRSQGPKDPKGSARRKYNRRKQWLAHALHQMQIAIDHLTAQKGTVYKRDEVETLEAAIDELIKKTGLTAPNQEPPSQEEHDAFMAMLNDTKPWVPPSREEMEALYSGLGLDYFPDEDEDDGGDDDDAPAA